MTNAAAIVADLRASIQGLLDLDTPAATRTAAVLAGLLRGETFETAAGLASGWHKDLQASARDAALDGLLALHGDLDDSAIADLIVAGIERLASFPPGARRPALADGYFVDLVRTGYACGWRNWRRLVGEARGQRDTGLATAAMRVWSASKPEV